MWLQIQYFLAVNSNLALSYIMVKVSKNIRTWAAAKTQLSMLQQPLPAWERFLLGLWGRQEP